MYWLWKWRLFQSLKSSGDPPPPSSSAIEPPMDLKKMMKMTAMVMIDYHHWVRRIFDQNTKNNVLTLKVASIPILEIVWRPSSALLVSHWTTHGLEKDIENMCSATSAKGYLMNAFQTFQTRWCVRSALLEIGIVLGQWSLLSHRVWTLKITVLMQQGLLCGLQSGQHPQRTRSHQQSQCSLACYTKFSTRRTAKST